MHRRGLTPLSTTTRRLLASQGNSCKGADSAPAAASVAAALDALLTEPSAGFRMWTAPSLTPTTTHCWHRRGGADRAEPTLRACENPQASSNLSHASGLMIGEPVHKRALASLAARWGARVVLLWIATMQNQTCNVMFDLMASHITEELGRPEILDHWAQTRQLSGLASFIAYSLQYTCTV